LSVAEKNEVMARQLDAAQAIAHVGSWEWEIAGGTVTWSDELYRIYGLEPRSRDITFEVFLATLHPDDRDRVACEIQTAIERGGRFEYRERIMRPDGTVRVLETIGEVVVEDGIATRLIGTCRDITEETEHAARRHRSERVMAGEREALELLASGAPLPEVLAAIVMMIEELEPAAIASILLLDERGEHLRQGAAPHLPPEYNRAIDGLAIGPRAGSCGTAAFLRQPVIVSDISTDALWEGYRELVAPYDLRACWSLPILTASGDALGTFAVYYRTARAPDAGMLELLARAAHVAGIAIERRYLDEQSRALTTRIEAAREDERTAIAREIHDELGQALTALKLDVGWLARHADERDAVTAKLVEMGRSADEIIQTMRRIAADLRPGILDQLGLRAAIEWQAEEFARRSAIGCVVRADIGDLQLDRGLATAVFRIFQEALTNIARHAVGASLVTVGLRLEHGQLVLEIADDGSGLPEIAPRKPTLGLLGMRERARRFGGDCVVRRREPRGTIVTVTVPLRFPAELADHELGA
jgi:PAS domain S-box-containing protein